MGYQNSVNSILQTLTGIQIGQRAIARVGEISKAQEAQNANVEAIKKHLTGFDKFKEAAKTGDFSAIDPDTAADVVFNHPEFIKGMDKEKYGKFMKETKKWSQEDQDSLDDAFNYGDYEQDLIDITKPTFDNIKKKTGYKNAAEIIDKMYPVDLDEMFYKGQPRTLKGLGKKARLEKHEYGNKK